MSSEKTYEMIPKEKFQEKIDILISQYHERINLNKQKKLLEGDTEKNAQKIKILEVTIKMLEDDMKYDNPHIWLEYKIEAYKNSSSEINTIADFKKHAQSPTYICHKRLHFLNKAMKEKFGKDIFDENLDQNM
jgi:DNA-binding XRE family transcriptional regulator